jgi:hypothetical protein
VIAGLGSVVVSCFDATTYGMQFQALTSDVTSVWTDDSIAGSSFRRLTSFGAVITYLNPGTGTRHVVVRAINSTKGGTWDIFIEGSTANGCLASFQHTS